MGWVNTPAFYQNRIVQEVLLPCDLFNTNGTGVCQWVDDSLLYSDNFEDALRALDKLLKRLIEKNLHINILKCELFRSTLTFCGRDISATGWTFQKKFWERVDIRRPEKRTDLAQLVYTCQWLSLAIPEFAAYRKIFEDMAGPYCCEFRIEPSIRNTSDPAKDFTRS